MIVVFDNDGNDQGFFIWQIFKVTPAQHPKPPKPNITKDMQEALKNLKQDDTITILPVD